MPHIDLVYLYNHKMPNAVLRYLFSTHLTYLGAEKNKLVLFLDQNRTACNENIFNLFTTGRDGKLTRFIKAFHQHFHPTHTSSYWSYSTSFVFLSSLFTGTAAMCYVCVSASVGLALLLAEGTRSHPTGLRQVPTSEPTSYQRDCLGPAPLPSPQVASLGRREGDGDTHTHI